MTTQAKNLTPRSVGNAFGMTIRTTSTMVRAFIMVKTAAGKSADLRDGIAGVEGVREAHVVAGQYDLIVEAEGEEVYDVIHSVATDVRDFDGVADTRTYICLE